MFTLNSLLMLSTIVAVILLWYESLRFREQVTRMCRELCDQSEMQLLDQSVSLSSVSLARNRYGRWQIRRVYQFAVSHNGADRHNGYVTLLGSVAEAIQIDNADGMSTLYPTRPGQLH